MKHFFKLENCLLLLALIGMCVLQVMVMSQNPNPAIHDFLIINLALLIFALVTAFGIAVYIAFAVQDILNFFGYDGESLTFLIAVVIFASLFTVDVLFILTTEQLSLFGTFIGLPVFVILPKFVKKIIQQVNFVKKSKVDKSPIDTDDKNNR